MTELISSEQLRVCNAGKKVMQIMTLHCESIYTANMTESMFLGDFYKLLFERFMNLPCIKKGNVAIIGKVNSFFYCVG